MKKNIFREALILHLIIDALAIPLICICLTSLQAEITACREIIEKPVSYTSDIEYDEDGFIIAPDEDFGPV